MELRQLKRFLAIVDEGSFVAAAVKLKVTPQALSTVIANLEKDLGVRVFDRTRGGNTELTKYGRALVPHARAQLQAEQRALEELSAMRDAGGGVVSVGVAESFSRQLMAAAIARVHREHPEIRIYLYEDYTEGLLERLWRGEIDLLAGNTSMSDAKDTNVVVEPLYSRDDIVVARKEHPLLARENITLADLRPYTWIVPAKRSLEQQVIVETFVSENLEPPERFIWSDALSTGTHLLHREDFLTMTAPALVGQMAPGSLLQRIPVDRPTIRRIASLTFLKEAILSPAVETLVDALRNLAPSVEGATLLGDARSRQEESDKKIMATS